MVSLLAFVGRAHAEEVAANRTDDGQNSMDKLSNEFITKLMDRVLPNHDENLDATTLGKPGSVAASAKSPILGARFPNVLPPTGQLQPPSEYRQPFGLLHHPASLHQSSHVVNAEKTIQQMAREGMRKPLSALYPMSPENPQNKDWYIIDAENLPPGRVATEVVKILKGKHKPTWLPHLVMGDKVIVINAEKVFLSGKKGHPHKGKIYYKASSNKKSGAGRLHGQKSITAGKILMSEHPQRVLDFAVKGMLQKHKLGRKQFLNYVSYVGDKHPHTAQQPIPLEVKHAKRKSYDKSSPDWSPRDIRRPPTIQRVRR